MKITLPFKADSGLSHLTTTEGKLSIFKKKLRLKNNHLLSLILRPYWFTHCPQVTKVIINKPQKMWLKYWISIWAPEGSLPVFPLSAYFPKPNADTTWVRPMLVPGRRIPFFGSTPLIQLLESHSKHWEDNVNHTQTISSKSFTINLANPVAMMHMGNGGVLFQCVRTSQPYGSH